MILVKKSLRKRGILIGAMALVIPLFSWTGAYAQSAEALGAMSFKDIQGHWSERAVERFAAYGVLSGNRGYFYPEDAVSRGELAVILDHLMGYQKMSTEVFKDVKASDWFAEAVLKANAAGILFGDGAGNAAPKESVTREQAALMLSRALGVSSNQESEEAGSVSGKKTGFVDDETISPWAREAVSAMVEKGYLAGRKDGTFDPKAPVKRGELVSLIDRGISAYYYQQGVYSGGDLSASANGKGTVLVRAEGVTLENMTIDRDLIIAEGVGEGEVTLSGTVVKGNLFLRGGGSNSIHIVKGSVVKGRVWIEKTEKGIRILSEDGGVDEIFTDSPCQVLLEGDFGEIVISQGASVTIKGNAQSLTIAGKAECTVSEGTVIDSMTIEKNAEGSDIKIAGTVSKLSNLTESTKAEVVETQPEEAVSLGGGGGGGGGAPAPLLITVPADPVSSDAAANLSLLKEQAAQKQESDYTVQSWEQLEAALSMSETTNTQVLAKIAAMELALGQLVREYSLSAFSASIENVVAGVFNLIFSKEKVEEKFAGIKTTDALSLVIAGSAAGSYQAVYVDSLSAWLACNIQGVTPAALQTGRVSLFQ